MSHFFKKRTPTAPTITRTHSKRSAATGKVPSLDLLPTPDPVFTKKDNAPELLFNLLNSVRPHLRIVLPQFFFNLIFQ